MMLWLQGEITSAQADPGASVEMWQLRGLVLLQVEALLIVYITITSW